MRERVKDMARKGADLIGTSYLIGPGAGIIRPYLPQASFSSLKPDWDTVLVLAPHPDDEIFGAGLLLTHLRDQGKKVTITYATNGGAYCTGAGGNRKGEAEASAKRLGAEAIFLELKDGNLENNPGLENQIADLTSQVRPQAVIAPWFGDYHPDHRALARATLSQPCPQAQYLFYATFSPLWPTNNFQLAYIMGGEEHILGDLEGYRASVNQETVKGFMVLRRTMARALLNKNCFWEPFLVAPGEDLAGRAEIETQWPPIYPTLKKTRHWRSFTRDVINLGKARRGK